MKCVWCEKKSKAGSFSTNPLGRQIWICRGCNDKAEEADRVGKMTDGEYKEYSNDFRSSMHRLDKKWRSPA